MEYLKRKIKLNKQESTQADLRVDMIDGIRMSLRFVNKETKDEDTVINFTKEETQKIKEVLRK